MRNSMIVAAQPEAAEAGAEVFERGGNAVDAALACALVQGVVDPQMCGIGGFGSMQVYMPKRGVHQVLEFYARAPLAAKPDMWLDQLAEQGFMVRPHVHWYWTQDQSKAGLANTRDKLAFSRTGRAIYFNEDGSVKRPGQIVHNPDLKTTLSRIAEGGPDLFYTGELAEEIAADFQANGGLLTREDLARFELSVAEPIWGDYRGYRISTNPPPSSGFPMLQLLHILENFDIGSLEHSGYDHIRLLAEAMKRMTIDKDQHMGDPAYVDVAFERLISKDYCAQLAQSMQAGERASVKRLDMSQRDTTHITAVDRDGNVVLLTHSLGSPSGAITNGLGFMYNGLMSRFDPRPGHAASIAPGKRRASSAAQAILFKNDEPFIALGAPGGSYIAPAIAQGIMNIIDYKMSMLEPVSAPRVVAVSDAIDVSNRVRRSVTAQLEENGYEVKRSPQSYAFAALHGIQIDNGHCIGGADPQRDGCAYAVS